MYIRVALGLFSDPTSTLSSRPYPYIVISTEGDVLCRRSGETCMLQSAMQMFVARFASRPAACLYRHYSLRGQAAGLSTPQDDKTILLRSR